MVCFYIRICRQLFLACRGLRRRVSWSLATKLNSSAYTTWSVGPRMVSGLFGKASMVLPLAKWIWVFWGLKAMPGGRLRVKAAMRAMIRLVWRQEGPTMPIALLGWVNAYFSRSAHMVWVLPLCLHHWATVNWFFSNNSANSLWYEYCLNPYWFAQRIEQDQCLIHAFSLLLPA